VDSYREKLSAIMRSFTNSEKALEYKFRVIDVKAEVIFSTISRKKEFKDGNVRCRDRKVFF